MQMRCPALPAMRVFCLCLFCLLCSTTLASPQAAAFCIQVQAIALQPGERKVPGVVTGRVEPICPEFTYRNGVKSPDQPCGLKRVESYALEPDTEGHTYISQLIDKPRQMIVDTGGARSELYSSAVREMGLKTMRANTAAHHNPYDSGEQVAMNGYVSDMVAIAPSISFGVLKFENATFSVVQDSRKPPLADNEIAGTLGPNHLMTFDVEFDFAAHRLNLYLQPHCAGSAVYWAQAYTVVPFTLSREGHILLRMTLDGKPVTATLDSGAPVSTLDMAAAARLFPIDRKIPGVDATGHDASLPEGANWTYSQRFKHLSVAGIDIQIPVLTLMHDRINESSDEHAPQLILGLREMSALHMFIACSEDQLYVTAAHAY